MLGFLRPRVHALVLALAPALLLAVTPPPAEAGGNVQDTGATSMLVKSSVPLTPDVVAAISALGAQTIHVWPEIQAMAVKVQPSKIPDLAASPLVAYVEYDGMAGVIPEDADLAEGMTAAPAVVVPLSSSTTPIEPWNQDMANTSGSSFTGAGVTVVVLDSGLPQNWEEFLPAGSVDLTHAVGFGPEGWGDFHNPVNAVRGVGGKIGLFPHGLAVSSVIVGFPSEWGFIGGAAPGATILPIRVLNQFNTGWHTWFTAAFIYAGNLKATGAVPGPMVINFSIQGRGPTPQIVRDAIDYALAQGVLFVTIAGNFNPSSFVSWPGSLPQSITAGAVGWRSEGLPPNPWFFGDVPEGDASQAYVASFSGREAPFVTPASQIDVVAPGSYVFGEWVSGPGFSDGREVAFDPTSNFIFGTSFAAPHVAGIVAQMLEKNPNLTQATAEAALRGTALPMTASPASFVTPLGQFVLPWDDRATGAGLVQGAAAVGAAPVALIAGRAPERGASNAGQGSLSLRIASRPGSLPVEFALGGAAGKYDVSVFDARGRLVRKWVADASSGATGTWDGRGGDGATVGSGVYLLRVDAGGRRVVTKAVVSR